MNQNSIRLIGCCMRWVFIAAVSHSVAAVAAPSAPKPSDSKPYIVQNIGRAQNMISKNDPIERKITNLMARMNLEEKIGQLTQYGGGLDKNGEDDVRKGKVGALLSLSGSGAEIRDRVNQLQRIAVEQSRLHIPLIIGHDVIHGCRTTFPIPLGIAASFDPGCAESASRIAATEARASGIHWTFAPMIDVARDSRWGRMAEGCGEDPYLNSVMGAAMVKGFQGNNLAGQDAVAACAKHFTAYGAAEAGRDYDTADISKSTLYNVYLYPYIAAVEAGMQTVMPSFNEVDGIPMSCNKELLAGWLKNKIGFDGFAVSDANAVHELVNHGVAATRADAARLALSAGMDMDMGSNCFKDSLAELLKSGEVKTSQINDAVRRILRVKFRLGLFENPYTDQELLAKVERIPQSIAEARRIAQKSLVLLKNQDGLLPLSKGTGSIAVIGDLAVDAGSMLGTWAALGRSSDVVTILDGIKKAVSAGSTVSYTQGCSLPGRYFDAPRNAAAANSDGIAKAVDAARKADVAVVVLGEHAGMNGEASSRSEIELPGLQQQLIEAVHAVGKPVVVVLVNGRALAIPWIAEHVPAILDSWHAGDETGSAVADVLFGDYNPAGRLPVTFPKSTGFCPMYYNRKNAGRPVGSHQIFSVGYMDTEYAPVYPYGYGLSYTTFEYTKLKVDPSSAEISADIHVSVDVKNTGTRAGDEVVQLYLQDVVSIPTRPVKELKRFDRITLQPGETKRLEFTLKSRDIAYFDDKGDALIQPGLFRVWVGGNSVSGLQGEFTLANGGSKTHSLKDEAKHNTGYVGGVNK